MDSRPKSLTLLKQDRPKGKSAKAFPNALHPITTGVIVGQITSTFVDHNTIYGRWCNAKGDSNSMVESSECRGSCGFESRLSPKTI